MTEDHTNRLPFLSSEVETPLGRALRMGISTALDTNVSGLS
jgi:hypothetical protein